MIPDNFFKPFFNDIGMKGMLQEYVFARMSEPHRHYHTMNHLAFMLHNIDSNYFEKNKEYRAAIYATFMHDIVYIPTKHDNEERSAAVAAINVCHTNLSEDEFLLSLKMIRASADHFKHIEDEELHRFLWADLSIFFAEWPIYFWYMNGVRKEYAHVSDEIYVINRIKFLENIKKYMGSDNIDKEIKLLARNKDG